jgi:hypothetical protein
MGATNAERQARWKQKTLALARIGAALRDYDAKLFARLQKQADRLHREKINRRRKVQANA